MAENKYKDEEDYPIKIDIFEIIIEKIEYSHIISVQGINNTLNFILNEIYNSENLKNISIIHINSC
jgi:uncharacterized circularly permuted ATP-grasp superfamily protein